MNLVVYIVSYLDYEGPYAAIGLQKDVNKDAALRKAKADLLQQRLPQHREELKAAIDECVARLKAGAKESSSCDVVMRIDTVTLSLGTA